MEANPSKQSRFLVKIGKVFARDSRGACRAGTVLRRNDAIAQIRPIRVKHFVCAHRSSSLRACCPWWPSARTGKEKVKFWNGRDGRAAPSSTLWPLPGLPLNQNLTAGKNALPRSRNGQVLSALSTTYDDWPRPAKEMVKSWDGRDGRAAPSVLAVHGGRPQGR